jgi:hypothetical protein
VTVPVEYGPKSPKIMRKKWGKTSSVVFSWEPPWYFNIAMENGPFINE